MYLHNIYFIQIFVWPHWSYNIYVYGQCGYSGDVLSRLRPDTWLQLCGHCGYSSDVLSRLLRDTWLQLCGQCGYSGDVLSRLRPDTWLQMCCGTCHMASLFSPLIGTTTTAVCSSSNLLVATLTQHLASHPTSAPLLTTSSPLPSPLTVTSHQDQKGLMPLLLFSIRDAFLTTYTLLPSHLSEDSHHEHFKLSHTHQINLKTLKIFIFINGVLGTNNISTAIAPHQRCQHPTKGILLLAQAKRTRKISSASSYCRSSAPSHDLCSVTKPTPHKTVLRNLTLASTEQVGLLLQSK